MIEDTFIKKCGAKYPWVKAKGGVNEKYGIKFFPSVYCIDANGVVHSVPDDRMPDEGAIEELLKSASLAPKMPADSRYDALRAMWEKSDFVKIRDYLDKMLAQPNLDAAMREVFEQQKAALTKKAEAQLQRVETLGKGPDFTAAEDQLKRIEKAWKAFPAGDAAKKELERFGADAAIKKELAADKALQKLLGGYDLGKPKDVKKLLPELEKFAKKFEGTYAATQANAQRGKLAGG